MLDQGNGVILFAHERIDQRQIGLRASGMKRILAFRLQLDRVTTFPDSILFPLPVGVE